MEPNNRVWMRMLPELEKEAGYTDCWIHQPTQTWLGLWKMGFSYRLRGGYLLHLMISCYFDICCGSDKEAYITAFKKTTTIITANHERGRETFAGIPVYAEKKPYPNDELFCAQLNAAYEDAVDYIAKKQNN